MNSIAIPFKLRRATDEDANVVVSAGAPVHHPPFRISHISNLPLFRLPCPPADEQGRSAAETTRDRRNTGKDGDSNGTADRGQRQHECEGEVFHRKGSRFDPAICGCLEESRARSGFWV
jgi:hypothetical protein